MLPAPGYNANFVLLFFKEKKTIGTIDYTNFFGNKTFYTTRNLPIIKFLFTFFFRFNLQKEDWKKSYIRRVKKAT
jgi:hypothetical protein